jgi:predicted RNA-binding Zn-ribbon protein involved in translation (DUF1610 family)
MLEARGMIELGGITGVEFRCSKCGRYMIRNLDELGLPVPGLGTSRACGGCGSELQYDESLIGFLKLIRLHAAGKRNYSVHLVGRLIGEASLTAGRVESE